MSSIHSGRTRDEAGLFHVVVSRETGLFAIASQQIQDFALAGFVRSAKIKSD